MLTSFGKRLDVHAWVMHRGLIGGDLPMCVITIPALTMRAFEVAWVSWWRINVRMAEKAGCLNEREREVS